MLDQESLAHLDKRFDRLEGKLDNHLERIAMTETDMNWIKIAMRYMGIVLLGLVGKVAHMTFFSK